MNFLVRRSLLALALLASTSAAVHAQAPAWALPVKAPDASPPPVDDGKPKRVPGGSRAFTQSQIVAIDVQPPDWHPDEHPAMPGIVGRSRAPAVYACAFCHLPNGAGQLGARRASGYHRRRRAHSGLRQLPRTWPQGAGRRTAPCRPLTELSVSPAVRPARRQTCQRDFCPDDAGIGASDRRGHGGHRGLSGEPKALMRTRQAWTRLRVGCGLTTCSFHSGTIVSLDAHRTRHNTQASGHRASFRH